MTVRPVESLTDQRTASVAKYAHHTAAASRNAGKGCTR